MADSTIGALTAITGGAVDDAADDFALWDESASATKRITREELFKGVTSNVGFGTATPSDELHIKKAAGPTIRIQDANTYFTLKQIDAGGGVDAFLDIDGVAATISDDAVVRFFRNTTAANASVQIAKGDASTTINHLFSGLGDSYVCSDNGNFGIGNNVPNRKLTVSEAANIDSSAIENTHATFSNNVLHLVATRAANSAYDLLRGYSGAGGDLEFKLRGDGNGTCDGSWTGGGADIAECLEFADGNANDEDRAGIPMVLERGKMRAAVTGEVPFGVVTRTYSNLGNSAPMKWRGKYERDAFGAYIFEDYKVFVWDEELVETELVKQRVRGIVLVEKNTFEIINGKAVRQKAVVEEEQGLFDEFAMIDSNGTPVLDRDGVQINHQIPRMEMVEVETKRETVSHSYPSDQVPAAITVPLSAKTIETDENGDRLQRRKLSAAFDPALEYIPRMERPEWDALGYSGLVYIRQGLPIAPHWVLMEADTSPGVDRYFIFPVAPA